MNSGNLGKRRGFSGPGRFQGIADRGFHNGGAGFAMNSHDNKLMALQVTDGHPCNNLSIETNDPATKNSRIFVGNIAKNRVSRSDLFVIFSKYGPITAISHLTSRKQEDHCCFAFVQFTTPASAEKAVISENGQDYYNYTLEVRLAEFKTGPQNQGSLSSSSFKAAARSQSGPLFRKNPSASSVNNIPFAKKRRMDQGAPPPDILLCGICHKMFDGIEAMIVHKREPCKSVKKCRCDEEDVPDAVACAICFKKFTSPWKLILHTHNYHNITICRDLESQGGDTFQAGEMEQDCAEPADADDGVDLDNLENDLLDEELI